MSKKANTTLLNNFEIAETDNFKKKLKSPDFRHLIEKITDYVYPQLRKNPFFGPNIKKLKGREFQHIYRYRIGSYRLFYVIEANRALVISVDIQKRKDAY